MHVEPYAIRQGQGGEQDWSHEQRRVVERDVDGLEIVDSYDWLRLVTIACFTVRFPVLIECGKALTLSPLQTVKGERGGRRAAALLRRRVDVMYDHIWFDVGLRFGLFIVFTVGALYAYKAIYQWYRRYRNEIDRQKAVERYREQERKTLESFQRGRRK